MSWTAMDISDWLLQLALVPVLYKHCSRRSITHYFQHIPVHYYGRFSVQQADIPPSQQPHHLATYWLISRDTRNMLSKMSFFVRPKSSISSNNSRHPFFQPNCKSIMVMPMNVKEFDRFFHDQLAIFCPNFVQNCEFRCSSKMLHYAFSSVFRPKRISCVRTN